MIVSKQNLRALTKEMFLNLMNEKGLAALEIIRNFNKKERQKMDLTLKEQWTKQIKEAVENGKSSNPPYQVIPYKNGMGIKKVIIEKREVA